MSSAGEEPRNPLLVDGDVTVRDCVARFYNEGTRCSCVVHLDEQRRPLWVFTDKDMLSALDNGSSLREVQAVSLATRDPVTISRGSNVGSSDRRRW